MERAGGECVVRGGAATCGRGVDDCTRGALVGARWTVGATCEVTFGVGAGVIDLCCTGGGVTGRGSILGVGVTTRGAVVVGAGVTTRGVVGVGAAVVRGGVVVVR